MPEAASLIHWIDWIALFVLVAALILAALTDAATFLIPNRYSVVVIGAYAVFAIGKPVAFSLEGIVTAVALFVVGAVLFSRGVMGGGDVKLLTATGLWAGFDFILLLLFTAAMAGGVLALAALSPLGRLMPAPPAGAMPAGEGWRGKLRQPVPFGVAVAIGGIAVALARLGS